MTTARFKTLIIGAGLVGTDNLDNTITVATATGGASPVPATRLLTAGNGLSGGGDLSADRTFTVNVDNTTIEISADTIRVKLVPADSVSVVDAGGYYAGTTVESVLQEVGAAADPIHDTHVWMPLTTTVGGEDVLVFDANHSLIPTLIPL